MYLRQSTTITIQVGPYLDATDGVTPLNALTPTVQVSKAGAAFGARNSATAISFDADGFYRVELNTTDTNTVGILKIKSFAGGAVPVWDNFDVLPQTVYDAMIAGSSVLPVNATQIEGVDATNQIRDSILNDATRFAGANIDAAVTTRAPASTALSTTQWTNTRAGKLDNVDVAVSTRLPTSSYVAPDNATITAIDDKTTNLPAIPASQGDVTTVGAAIGALNNISTSQVKAQMVAALSTDTYAEPVSVPAATASLAAKIGWLMTLGRNKLTQTDTTQTLYADNGSSVIATATVSDDLTTSVRNEFA